VFTSISASLAAKNANVREGGLLVTAALAGSVGRPAEPYLRPLLGRVQGMLADEAASVRAAAASAQVGLVQCMGVGVGLVSGAQWQGLCGKYALCKTAPMRVAAASPQVGVVQDM
jgi:hypothetical protein